MEDKLGGGSYELYDSQKSAHLSSGENRPPQGMAPGCPGSPQDLQQMLEEKEKELAERRLQEVKLRQMISDLRSSLDMAQSGSFGESPFLNAEGASGSPTSDSVGESVKDAHLKHLQRQVTILQANLYKAEGWTARVEEARKEKDKALDDLRSVTTELQMVKDEKRKLQQDFNSLTARHTDLQQKLEATLRNLEQESSRHERNQSQTSRLQEELSTAKAQLETLKESVQRLSQENKTLKQKGQNTSSQSAAGQSTAGQGSAGNNTACNQELEYLHAVVDQLKNTVLEQRNFLVTLRPQSMMSGSLTSRSERSASQGPSSAMKEHLFAMSKSTGGSPGLPAPYSESDFPMMSQALSSQSDRMSASAGPLNMTTQLSAQRAGVQNGGEGYNMLNGAAPRLTSDLNARVNNPSSVASGIRTPQLGAPASHAEQLAAIGMPHRVSGGALEKKKAQLQPQMSAPMRKISQSEVLARRANSDATMSDNRTRAKTDTMLRQDRTVQAADPKAYPQWMFNNNGQMRPSNVASEASNLQTAMPAQLLLAAGGPSPRYEAAVDMSAIAASAQYKLMGNGMRDPAQPQRLQNPPLSPAHVAQQQQHQQLRRQQVFPNTDTVRVINNDMMGGGRMLQNADIQPPVTSQRGTRESSPLPPASPMVFQTARAPSPVVSRAVAADSDVYQFESEVDPAPPAPQLNADRVCPVCSKNFAQLSMEEFQTHVFECFDDENAPETMKPIDDASSERTCPMCNIKFGKETSQAEYEKHVHSHFGEEGPGENFEVLYP